MADEKVLREFSNYWRTLQNDNDKTYAEGTTRRSFLEAKRYIKRRYGDNIPDKEIILEDFYNQFLKSDKTSTSLSNIYLLKTIDDFLQNPASLFKTYEEQRDVKAFWAKTDKDYYKYTVSKKESKQIFAHDVFHNISNYDGRPFRKEDLLNPVGEKKQLLVEYLQETLKIARKQLLEKITKDYINSTINVIKTLNELGVLSEYIKRNNEKRMVMGIELLTFPSKKTEGSERYSVDQLMDYEFLKSLSFEKLVLIYGFYSNRLKKIADTIGLGLFICEKTNDFSPNNKEPNMLDVTRAYLQHTAIAQIHANAIPKIYDNLEHYSIEGGYKGKRYVAASSEKIYEEFFQKYEEAYSAYSGGQSSLDEDFYTYFYVQVADYVQKDFSIETLLVIFTESLSKSNWGYIPETADNGVNSIKRDKENILLGFDVDGLNMPVRLHMPLEKVRAFFRNFDKTYNIPNYVGNEDMEVWDKNMGASILMPLSPKHRKQVISFVKAMNPKGRYYNFAKHIQCMQYENNLARIQRWKGINSKKDERKYTNLLTGEETTLGRDR